MAAGIAKQITTLICGFVLPRFMLLYYGSAVNGMLASITHFLSFISFLDMGVGAVIQANLYKPLADKNNIQISQIIKASERFFRKLAYIFIGYIIILCFIFPKIIDANYGSWFTISLLLIVSFSSIIQYLFGMTYQLLLNADQKSYVPLFMQIGTIFLNTIFAIILMYFGASVHFVKLMTAMVYLLRPIGQTLYVKTHYHIDHKIRVEGEPIHQKWNGFSQHFASVVCQNIDVVVLTIFTTLENISIYSVYFMVTSGVEQIIMTATTGLEALFGNMLAKKEKKELLKTFCIIEWTTHSVVSIVFTIAAITIVPFIAVYTRGIKDVNYISPLFGILLVTAYATECLRVPYFRIIKAAGKFKETQNGAYISALLNIGITITLVFRYGLIGAALGTLIAMFYHTCYIVLYLQKNILERSTKFFFNYLLTDCLIASISFWLTRKIEVDNLSYFSWILYACKISISVIIVAIVVHLVCYRTKILTIVQLLKRYFIQEGMTYKLEEKNKIL